LILSNKHEIVALNSISGFRDVLFTSSPLLAVFSGDVVDKEANATHGSFPVKTGSSILIYFQNVNRLRSKTSDLFKAVILNDFDIIVLLETSLVNSFHDEELIDNRYFFFRCDRSAASCFKKSSGGVLIAVKSDFDTVIASQSAALNLNRLSSILVAANLQYRTTNNS
jgi:hypothetical protein